MRYARCYASADAARRDAMPPAIAAITLRCTAPAMMLSRHAAVIAITLLCRYA